MGFLKQRDMQAIDRLDIKAPANKIFDLVLQYPRMNEHISFYRCEIIQGDDNGKVKEGSRVHHKIGMGPLKSGDFIRTIRKIVPNERIEETYDEGDMVGTGVWTFEQKGDITTVTFDCRVRSNSPMYHLNFSNKFGEAGHHWFYQKILNSLKNKCE